MLLHKVTNMDENREPLVLREIPVPEPGFNEVLIKLSVCGVCHTELDEIEGRAMPAFFPIIPGHQGVGIVEKCGIGCKKTSPGERVGVAWIFSACGTCRFCTSGRENLCAKFKATGRDANGAYAEYLVIGEDFSVKIPKELSDVHAAPLLCAGAIGYRSVRLAAPKEGDNIGLMGFGASAHLVIKMLRYLYGSTGIFVFSRTEEERRFAMECGATWSGDIGDRAPVMLNSIIDTTPAWNPVLESLGNLEKGGRLVINAIRKENTDRDLLTGISYEDHLWWEKEIKSVANITTKDVTEFLELSIKAGIRPTVTEYALEEANVALMEIKTKKIKGAKVLRIGVV